MADLVNDVGDKADVTPARIERYVDRRTGRSRRAESVEVLGIFLVEIDHHGQFVSILDSVRYEHEPFQRSAVICLPLEKLGPPPAVIIFLGIDRRHLFLRCEPVPGEIEVITVAEITLLESNHGSRLGLDHGVESQGIEEIFRSPGPGEADLPDSPPLVILIAHGQAKGLFFR